MQPNQPVDPNQNQNPGQNQPLKPKVDKLKFEDVFDQADIAAKMAAMLRVSALVEKEDKKASDIHLKYLKVVETAERHKHTLLMKEQKDVLDLLEKQKFAELEIAKGSEPKNKRKQAMSQVEADFAAKALNVQKKMAPKLAEADKAALKSEGGNVVQMAGMKMMEFMTMLPKLAVSLSTVSTIVGGVINVLKLGMDTLADLTKVQADLRAGGMGLNESARSIDAAQRAFSILGQDMEVLGQNTGDVNRLVSELSKSPDALKNLMSVGGPAAWKNIRDAMGEFGVTADQTASMVTDAANTQNLSMEDVSKMFLTAGHISKDSGINFKDAFNSLLNMNAEMRNVTFNTDEARKIFTSTAFALRNMSNFKFSATEAVKFASSITTAIGGMTVEKMTGVMAFVKGRMPTEAELAKGMGLDTITAFMNKAMGGNFEGAQSLVKIEKLMGQLGISLGGSPVQGAKAMQTVLTAFKNDHGAKLQDVMEKSLDSQMSGSEKQAKQAAKEMQAHQEKGFQALSQMVSPLDKLSAAMGDFVTDFTKQFMPAFKAFAINFDRFVKATTFENVRAGAHNVENFAGRIAGTDHPHYRSHIEENMDNSARNRQRVQFAKLIMRGF